MSDERKIIGLFNRQPVDPPPVVEGEGRPVAIDTAAIELLKNFIAAFERGECYGLMILSGRPDGHGGIAWVTPTYCDTVWDYDQVFIGACHQAAYDIIRIVEADMMDAMLDD
jgi:hypothetical protein